MIDGAAGERRGAELFRAQRNCARSLIANWALAVPHMMSLGFDAYILGLPAARTTCAKILLRACRELAGDQYPGRGGRRAHTMIANAEVCRARPSLPGVRVLHGAAPARAARAPVRGEEWCFDFKAPLLRAPRILMRVLPAQGARFFAL